MSTIRTARPRGSAPLRFWRAMTRPLAEADRQAFSWLALVSVVLCAGIAAWPTIVPAASIALPLTLGALLLGPRELPRLIVGTLVLLAVGLAGRPSFPPQALLAILMVYTLGIIILIVSNRRRRLGVGGVRGEDMFVDLRDRLMRVSDLPVLPPEWYAEAQLRTAGGTPFAGDFVVTSLSPERRRLDVAVVDVSGRGEQAGVRALQLSGAFGALQAAVPSAGFLDAANAYLIRQDWDEGFATAIHVSLDLVTGAFDVRCAGHPPAVRFHSGSGRWTPVPAEGPLLGLLDDIDFPPVSGQLAHGDALLLYTDGLVEEPGRDIDIGIDRLLGRAESQLRHGFSSERIGSLIDTLGSENDDRALVVLHRR